MNFFTRNWLALIAIGLLVFMIFRGQGCTPDPKPRIDTVTTTKTEYIQQPPQYIPVYIPQQTGSQPPVIIPPQYQPNQDMTKLVAQYNELVQKFLATNTYNDSIELKDSAGKKVGIVNLEDKISENKVQGREVDYQLAFPLTTVTNTITIREPYIPRNQLYAGLGLIGTPSQLVNGAKAEVLFKNKKDFLFGGAGGFQSYGGQVQPTFELKALWKIKLK